MEASQTSPQAAEPSVRLDWTLARIRCTRCSCRAARMALDAARRRCSHDRPARGAARRRRSGAHRRCAVPSRLRRQRNRAGRADDKLLTTNLELPPRNGEIPLDQIARAEFGRSLKVESEALEFAYWDLPAPRWAAKSTHVMGVGCRHEDCEPFIDAFETRRLRAARD